MFQFMSPCTFLRSRQSARRAMYQGYRKGYARGLGDGFDEGNKNGTRAGFAEGEQLGRTQGFKEGCEQGRREAYLQASHALHVLHQADDGDVIADWGPYPNVYYNGSGYITRLVDPTTSRLRVTFRGCPSDRAARPNRFALFTPAHERLFQGLTESVDECKSVIGTCTAREMTVVPTTRLTAPPAVLQQNIAAFYGKKLPRRFEGAFTWLGLRDRCGYRQVIDLLLIEPDALLRYKGFGTESLTELRDKLAEVNLALWGDTVPTRTMHTPRRSPPRRRSIDL